MPIQFEHAQTGIEYDHGTPIVIDVEAALDDVYSALGNHRRRITLCAAIDESTPIDIEDLAETVALQELQEDAGELTEEKRAQVHVSLYHNHLPRLSDLNLVKFDTESGVISDTSDSISPIRT